MTRKEREALQRLEEALLEEQPQQPDPLTEVYADFDGDVYNTDRSDVDMDAYSENVRHGRRRNPLGVVFALFTTGLLACCILFLLKMMEVI